MQKPQTLMIVDAYNFLFRAYFALPPLEYNGIPVGAVYGFINILFKYITTEPEYLVITSDTGGSTFREAIYPKYKANRPPAPGDLTPQFELLREAVKAFNFNFLESKGFEADDIIATLVKKFKKNDIEIVVVSSDKDLMQLVDEGIKILDPIKNKFFDSDAVKQKLGISPSQVVDYFALTGDASDNISGIPGIGPKTAASLLNQFGSIKCIDTQQIKRPKLRQSLIEFADQAEISRSLVKLRDDISITDNLEDLKYRTPNQSVLLDFLEKYGFKALIPKLIGNNKKSQKSTQAEIQSAGNAEDFFLNAKYSGIIGIYQDKNDLQIATKELCIKTKKELLPQKFSSLLQDESIVKVFYDTDPDFASQTSCEDLQKMAYSISTKGNDLPSLVLQYLGQESAEKNAAQKLVFLYDAIKYKMAENKVFFLYYKIDKPLRCIINTIQSKGVLVDLQHLYALKNKIAHQTAEQEEAIFKIVGEKFLISSTKQLAFVLFEKMMLPIQKKSKTGNLSTDSEVLEKLSSQGFEIANHILAWRKFTKLQNTYIDPLILKAEKSDDNRIHTTYCTTSTLTGRFSSYNPNLQNIPREDYMRKIFVAKKGYSFICADYSQIELRILAYIANVKALKGALESGIDLHQATAKQIFKTENITKELRNRSKAINFGIIYGITGFGLAAQLDISQKEASQYIESYLNTYPEIKNYMQATKDLAKQNGFVKTLMGRKCYIQNINSANFGARSIAERSAINAPIQGTAADIIRFAMVNCAKSGLVDDLVMQVHDELVFEIKDEDIKTKAHLIKSVMESASTIPVLVDLKIGKNLGQTKIVEFFI